VPQQISVRDGFKKLSLVVSAWAVVLVCITITARITEFLPVAAWAEHWLVSSITAGLVTTTALIAWQQYRQIRSIVWATTALAITASIQILLAATTGLINAPPVMVAAGLFVAMFNLGAALFLATATHLSADVSPKLGVPQATHRFFTRSITLTGLGLLLLLVTGVLVSGTGSGPACADWPLCRGEIFPANFTFDVAISLLHRFTVVVVGVLVAGVLLQTRRGYQNHTTVVRWSMLLGWLFLVQVAAGGLYMVGSVPPVITKIIHLGLMAIIWGNLVVLAAIGHLAIPTLPADRLPAPVVPPLSARQKAVTFFKLTKPWILVLLLITTVTAMFIAAKGLPSISLILYTFLGGVLAAGGASVLNSYIDSDIDQVMSRTSRRATVTGLVTPQETLIFGLVLSALSFLIYAIFVNLISAVLSSIGIVYYVFFYTLYLKRKTVHNIVIGGAAGAIPPLVGWTAVTNSLGLGALFLFAIIFFWTPPHTWALALLVKKDYARAKVPMLPVVVGEKETTYQIFLYTVLLVALTLLPFSSRMAGALYLISAVVLGLPFIYLAWKLWRNFDKRVSKQLYKFSQAYLALLFLMMAIDRTLF